jgi:peptide/nickel transport system substrate-binding protein
MNVRPVFSCLLGLVSFAIVTLDTARAQSEPPKYGGSLEVGTVFVALSALSWDSYDWPWKHTHDTGAVYEQLFSADLSKTPGHGGKSRLVDGYLPPDLLRGELAEKLEWENTPLAIKITLRKGVMFPEKPGVMSSRELVADDVVFSFNRLNESPKKQKGIFDFIKKVSAPDKYTVVFELNEFNAEWAYRFGYGPYSGIVPKEVVAAGAADWKHVTGSGPFKLTNYVAGNSQTYESNKAYWDRDTVGTREYRMPFVDRVTYRIIKDEATQITALRTGKLDILESIRWQNVESLKASAPELKWNRWFATSPFLVMRTDTKPFDDVRVRRALNMAVNKEEIVKTYYNGNAELFAYPQHPGFGAYFQPLEEQPSSVQELYKYDPVKARKLLADAGYPEGFTFKTQVCSCNADHMDLLPLIASYLEKVGVKLEIQPMEYVAFLSAMTTRTNAPGYLMNNGHSNPTTTLRKNFVPGQIANASQWNDPAFNRRLDEAYAERDESKRQALIRALTTEILEKAPNIWLPTPYIYTAWWPWVKNYGGELSAGTTRPGPIYARVWIDQDLKAKMSR